MEKSQVSLNSRIIILLVLMTLSSCNTNSQIVGEPVVLSYHDVPIHVELSVAPTPVKGGDGKWYASYHLLLSNRSHVDLVLKRVDVFGKDDASLLQFDKADLEDYYKFRANLAPVEGHSKQTIKSGNTGILLFWIALENENLIPDRFKHRFTFDYSPYIEVWNSPYPKDQDIVLENYYVEVDKGDPVVIGSPLKGNRWKVGNGPGEYKTNHQYILTREGATRNPQRYGIDFQIVDEKNIMLPTPLPEVLTNEMFYCYGQELLAIADGVIANIKDGIPENTPQASGEIITGYKMNSETVAGNYLSIKIGEDQYIHYAHLIPGSLRFKLGDKVEKGQVIGLLGNSGNSTGPHLHFNFTNGTSANGSRGLPYVFESFQNVSDEKMHYNEIPLNRTLINFNR